MDIINELISEEVHIAILDDIFIPIKNHSMFVFPPIMKGSLIRYFSSMNAKYYQCIPLGYTPLEICIVLNNMVAAKIILEYILA